MNTTYWIVAGVAILVAITVGLFFYMKKRGDTEKKAKKETEEKAEKEKAEKEKQPTTQTTKPLTINDVVTNVLNPKPANFVDLDVNKVPCSLSVEKIGCGAEWQMGALQTLPAR